MEEEKQFQAEHIKKVAEKAAEKVLQTAFLAATDLEKLSSANQLMALNIDNIKENMGEIKADVKALTLKDYSCFVLKDDFNFWRNLLISGMLLSIFIAVVIQAVTQFAK